MHTYELSASKKFRNIISALFGVVLILGSMSFANDNKTALAATPATLQQLSSEEWAFLPLINNLRAQNGLPPLQVSNTLTISSKWMSNDMATHNYFDHTDSLGRNPQVRMSSFGYTANATGENIAAGFLSAQDALTAWENSPGHLANMLNRKYNAVGIGRVELAGSPYKVYWTTDFGSTIDQTLAPQGENSNTSIAPTPLPTAQPTATPVIHKFNNATQCNVSLWQRLFGGAAVRCSLGATVTRQNHDGIYSLLSFTSL